MNTRHLPPISRNDPEQRHQFAERGWTTAPGLNGRVDTTQLGWRPLWRQIANHWHAPTSPNVAFKRHINVEAVDCRKGAIAIAGSGVAIPRGSRVFIPNARRVAQCKPMVRRNETDIPQRQALLALQRHHCRIHDRRHHHPVDVRCVGCGAIDLFATPTERATLATAAECSALHCAS